MPSEIELDELHWLLAITQNIDVGVVVLDRGFRVQVWNTFMENRSGIPPGEAINQLFFHLFPEVDRIWFSRKLESVITLGTAAFTVWEQRPFVVKFKNFQPITAEEEYMYQNTTMLPLRSATSEIGHVCLVIYDVTEVAVNRRLLQASNLQLQRLSNTDRLTGLHNRGHWEESLKLELARHKRYGNPAALIMFDIDHFKRVNDTYGHPIGDIVIQRVAAAAVGIIREADIFGRYGGEEFAVLLPDTDKESGRILAERLRMAIEAEEVFYEGARISFTISLGVADLNEFTADYQQLIGRADLALYAAKNGGRNQVSVFS